MSKSIQIPVSLYNDLVNFVAEAGPDAVSDPDLYRRIADGVEEKDAAMRRRSLYTASKTSTDPTVRESARQAYLDAQGIPQGYRWSTGGNNHEFD